MPGNFGTFTRSRAANLLAPLHKVWGVLTPICLASLVGLVQ